MEKPVKPTRWTKKRKLILAAMLFTAVVGLAVGLGVGLTEARYHRWGSSTSSDSFDSSTTSTTPSPSSTGSGTVSASVWKPQPGVSWNYDILKPVTSTSTNGVQVMDIDLFDNDASVIAGLQARGAKVICYFSAGSYENWRPDSDSFSDSDKGKELDGWPGENWLQIGSDDVHQIMLARLDIAVLKKCDGVDPDNVDGYDNDNGLGLTSADSVKYMQFLADEAHKRNLAIGLKNAGAIIPDVIDIVEYSVNEQCVEFDECDTYAAFIKSGKPVFHVEYPKGDSTDNNDLVASNASSGICGDQAAAGFSTIIKNKDLDSWMETCSG